MGILSTIKGQLRSVIEWKNPNPDLVFERWTHNGDEIKNASKLIIQPGQGCLFVYEGQIEGVFDQEGLYDLSTDNIPFWTTVKKIMQAFESEHKVGIYFYRKADFLDKRWGTQSVIKYDDPKYKFPVGLRAFGNYSMRISNAEFFFKTVVASKNEYWVKDIQDVFLSRITQPMTNILANAKFSYAEVDANRSAIAAAVKEAVFPIFAELGFELSDFRIEGTNFDEDTERRIGRIADMNAEAQAAAATGLNYAQMQQLDAMKSAAQNQSGLAGMGMQMNTGMHLNNMMTQGFNNEQQVAQQQNPPNSDDPMEKLAKLKKMFELDLIDESEYKTKKAKILEDM